MQWIIAAGVAVLMAGGAARVSAQTVAPRDLGAPANTSPARPGGEPRWTAPDSTGGSGPTEPRGIRRAWTPLAPGTHVASQDTVFVAHPSRRGPLALLIAGGAGVVAGLIADESTITIVSAGIAGVGLYLLVR